MKTVEYGATAIKLSAIFCAVLFMTHQYFVNSNVQNPTQSTQNPDRTIAIIGLILVIGQLWISLRQTGISGEQNAIMAKQALIQTETSRPHVAAIGINIIVEGDTHIFGVIWKNSGATPPINMTIGMQLSVIPRSWQAIGFDYRMNQPLTKDVPLGVNREIIVNEWSLTHNQFADLDLNKDTVLIWGNGSYTDKFSPGIIHRIEYCFRMRMENGSPRFQGWGDHNRTYDEQE